MKPRKNLPVKLRNKLFDEVRATCPNPACKALPGVSTLEIHHIDGREAGDGEENLIALCPTCHTLAEKGFAHKEEVRLWKRMLCSRHHPRLGPETAADLKAPPKRKRPRGPKFVAKGNNGPVQQAETIHNHVSYGEAPRGPIILPGTVGSDPNRYNYLEYLIEQLADFRAKGRSYGQVFTGKIHPGVVRNQIRQKYGALPKNLLLEKWPRVVADQQAKIDNTILGRNNRKKGIPNYKTFEEFCALGEA